MSRVWHSRFLLVALPGVGLLLSMQGCATPQVSMSTASQASQPLHLEFDAIEGTVPVTGIPGWSMKDSYGEGGIALTIDDSGTIAANPAFRDGCVTIASLDQILGCSKEFIHDDSSVSPWYAHGLAVPWQVEYPGGTRCDAAWGRIWLAGAACPAKGYSGLETGIREDFVVFYKSITTDQGKMIAAVHELGHVLNLHHCEYDQDGLNNSGRLGTNCKEHLKERTNDALKRHVLPGPHGEPFCKVPNSHIKRLHPAGQYCCGPNLTPGDSSSVAPATLRIEPEKCDPCDKTERPRYRYFPGEPITVNVTLDSSPSLAFLPDASLDPGTEHLTFWTQGSTAEEPDRLRIPMRIDGNPPGIELKPGGPVVQEGIGIWYGTGLDQGKSFHLTAGFSGFKGSQRIRSNTVKVEILHGPELRTPLYDPVAASLFNHPEARRYLWLLGGDHLKRGERNLKTIAERYGDTIFAPYANLALGANLVRPFHHVGEDGALRERQANLPQARSYLGAAQEKKELLPFSYQRLLDKLLEQAQEDIESTHQASQPGGD